MREAETVTAAKHHHYTIKTYCMLGWCHGRGATAGRFYRLCVGNLVIKACLKTSSSTFILNARLKVNREMIWKSFMGILLEGSLDVHTGAFSLRDIQGEYAAPS